MNLMDNNRVLINKKKSYHALWRRDWMKKIWEVKQNQTVRKVNSTANYFKHFNIYREKGQTLKD